MFIDRPAADLSPEELHRVYESLTEGAEAGAGDEALGAIEQLRGLLGGKALGVDGEGEGEPTA